MKIEKSNYVSSFQGAAFGSCCLNQQICSVIMFLLSYFGIQGHLLDSFFLVIIIGGMTVLLILIYCYSNQQFREKSSINMCTALICVGYGFGISPIIKTLTDTISTDTIYAMVIIAFFLHLLVHNYGIEATMLEAHLDVFCLLTLGLTLFALLPAIRNYLLLNSYAKTLVTLTLVYDVFIVVLLYFVSRVYMTLMVLTFVIINVVLPWIFVHWQCHKRNIYGPWDEATINNERTIVRSVY